MVATIEDWITWEMFEGDDFKLARLNAKKNGKKEVKKNARLKQVSGAADDESESANSERMDSDRMVRFSDDSDPASHISATLVEKLLSMRQERRQRQQDLKHPSNDRKQKPKTAVNRPAVVNPWLPLISTLESLVDLSRSALEGQREVSAKEKVVPSQPRRSAQHSSSPRPAVAPSHARPPPSGARSGAGGATSSSAREPSDRRSPRGLDRGEGAHRGRSPPQAAHGGGQSAHHGEASGSDSDGGRSPRPSSGSDDAQADQEEEGSERGSESDRYSSRLSRRLSIAPYLQAPDGPPPHPPPVGAIPGGGGGGVGGGSPGTVYDFRDAAHFDSAVEGRGAGQADEGAEKRRIKILLLL